MVEWMHADRDGRCGLCNALIRQGDPVRVMTVSGVTKRFVRCQECAGGAPPDRLTPAALDRPRDVMAPLTAAMPDRTRGALRRLAGSPLKAVGE